MQHAACSSQPLRANYRPVIKNLTPGRSRAISRPVRAWNASRTSPQRAFPLICVPPAEASALSEITAIVGIDRRQLNSCMAILIAISTDNAATYVVQLCPASSSVHLATSNARSEQTPPAEPITASADC